MYMYLQILCNLKLYFILHEAVVEELVYRLHKKKFSLVE